VPPDPHVADTPRTGRSSCVRDGQIVCVDDLCHGVSTTLCGLEEGIDFGLESDDPYDDWQGA